MAEAVAQLNTRMPQSVKQGGDVVLDALGLSATEVIRALWQYLYSHQSLPEVLRDELTVKGGSERARRLSLAKSGAGLALQVAQDECGYPGAAVPESGPGLAEARDEMYDDMLDEMLETCR